MKIFTVAYRLLLALAPRGFRLTHADTALELAVARVGEERGARRIRRGAFEIADLVLALPRFWREFRTSATPVHGGSMFSDLISDFVYGLRSLRHQKSGSSLVVAMLALGIGANVAVFSLINGLFLKPLPFPYADRLVYINETAPRWNLETTGITYADFVQWQKEQHAFDAIALYAQRSFNVATAGDADRMDGASVTADFARVLGIEPIMGRMFTAEEDRPNGPNVVVIGTAVWHERFGARRDILGQTIRLNSREFTVIGVLPVTAEFPGGVRLWTPLQGDPNSVDSYSYEGVGRLKAGITLEQGASDLLRAHQPIFETRDQEKNVSPLVRDLRAHLTGNYQTIVSTLGAAVSLLLLVACANVAALMLARALGRRREIGIRLAVGATRTRLLRQLVVENLLLSVCGAVVGLVVGNWAIQVLIQSLPTQAPRWAEFTLDTRMALFTLAASIVTAVLFGWAPALHAMNADLRGAVAASTAGSTPMIRGRRTLRALVVAEFAVASLMFVCGGLLVRAHERVRNVDPGFDPKGVYTLTVSLPRATYPDAAKRVAFGERLEARARTLPGVTDAGLVTCAPLSNCHWGVFFHAEGEPPRGPNDPNPVILNRMASPGYFSAMGIRLKEGRFFNDSDGREGTGNPTVLVVNESFARTMWPGGGSPIGKRVRQGANAPWLTVVGVVEDVRHYGLERPARPGVYVPMPRNPQSAVSLALKTSGDPAQLAAMVRGFVREMDPELPIYDARTMEERMALSMTLRAAYSWMLGVFASIALLLALGGSYGVTSYLVSQRTRELGIRVALGACRSDISRAVLKGSLGVVSIGVVIGVASAIGAGRFLSALLFGVPPYDAAILTIAAIALFSTGVLANWLPARRASRVDPMLSLRAD